MLNWNSFRRNHLTCTAPWHLHHPHSVFSVPKKDQRNDKRHAHILNRPDWALSGTPRGTPTVTYIMRRGSHCTSTTSFIYLCMYFGFLSVCNMLTSWWSKADCFLCGEFVLKWCSLYLSLTNASSHIHSHAAHTCTSTCFPTHMLKYSVMNHARSPLKRNQHQDGAFLFLYFLWSAIFFQSSDVCRVNVRDENKTKKMSRKRKIRRHLPNAYG